jgi:hypothetical protein
MLVHFSANTPSSFSSLLSMNVGFGLAECGVPESCLSKIRTIASNRRAIAAVLNRQIASNTLVW